MNLDPSPTNKIRVEISKDVELSRDTSRHRVTDMILDAISDIEEASKELDERIRELESSKIVTPDEFKSLDNKVRMIETRKRVTPDDVKNAIDGAFDRRDAVLLRKLIWIILVPSLISVTISVFTTVLVYLLGQKS